MSIVSRIIGTVTFNRGTLRNLVNKNEATAQAWFLIFLGSAISAIVGAQTYELTGNPEYLGFASFFASDANTFVKVLFIVFTFQFLLIIFLALVLSVVGRAFGGNFSTLGLVRLIGFASVIAIVGNLLVYISALQNDPSILVAVGILNLWQFLVVIYGYSVGGGINILVALVAFIIGVIIAGLLLGLVIVLFIAVFLVAIISVIGIP